MASESHLFITKTPEPEHTVIIGSQLLLGIMHKKLTTAQIYSNIFPKYFA